MYTCRPFFLAKAKKTFFIDHEALKKAARFYKLLDRKKAIEIYKEMGRQHLDIMDCYALEGEMRQVEEWGKKFKDKIDKLNAQEDDINRKISKLKRSGKKDTHKLKELEDKKFKLLLDHYIPPPDDLSVLSIFWFSWKEKIDRTTKPKEKLAEEGLYHLAAISYLKSGEDDLAKEYFEKAISRFDKMGYQKALEGDLTSFRIYLKKFCCQLLALTPKIGSDVTKVPRGSLEWQKLVQAYKTIQSVFELDYPEKGSKEFLKIIAFYCTQLRRTFYK